MSHAFGLVVIPAGVHPEEHEVATSLRLVAIGFDVRFRVIDHTAGAKNPDVDFAGEIWELKSPKGSSEKSTIDHQFRRGRKQAKNLVIDLARCGLSDELAIAQIRRRFKNQSGTVKVIVLDHMGSMTRIP